MIDSKGEIRTTISNQLGFYRFAEVPVGETYIFSVTHKQYKFEPRFLSVTEEERSVNFVALR